MSFIRSAGALMEDSGLSESLESMFGGVSRKSIKLSVGALMADSGLTESLESMLGGNFQNVILGRSIKYACPSFTGESINASVVCQRVGGG